MRQRAKETDTHAHYLEDKRHANLANIIINLTTSEY